MEYSRSFRLDMRPAHVPYVVQVKQRDRAARFLRIQLTMNNVVYTPESGVAFLFRCRRPDGSVVTEDSTVQDEELGRYLVINQGNGLIQVELTDEATAMQGRCICDLCLVKNEQVLSTDLFALDVVASPDVSELLI